MTQALGRHNKLCCIDSMEGDVMESCFFSILLKLLKNLTLFVHVTKLFLNGECIRSCSTRTPFFSLLLKQLWCHQHWLSFVYSLSLSLSVEKQIFHSLERRRPASWEGWKRFLIKDLITTAWDENNWYLNHTFFFFFFS